MDFKKLEAAGVDYCGALQRLMGNEALYTKFLRKFMEDDHAQGAKEAFEKMDYEEVFSQVHALKGLSGTLGLNTIYEEAHKIICMIRTDDMEQMDVHINKLLEEEEKLFAVIQEIL